MKDDDELDTQDRDDREILFFLQILLNDYDADDIARVAMDMAISYQEQFDCVDCDENVVDKHEFFLVHDELEDEVELDMGRLCVKCFEKRLGRELCYFDFTKAMILNDDLILSPLLQQRMINKLEETLPKE